VQFSWIHSDPPLTYTGDQLTPHWVFRQTGLLGPAVAAFAGPAFVDLAHMVDWEDVQSQSPIAANAMLHFVAELFDMPFSTGVALQRLWISAIQQDIHARLGQRCLTRDGNDLWWLPERRKLSVAITTVSPTSVLMHYGVNITRDGAPVPTVGLTSDLGLTDIPALAHDWGQLLIAEWADIQRGVWKVRAVSA
jgi:uncharacterized protein